MKFTRLSFPKRSRIVQCFIEDVDATLASRLLLINRKTVNAWYREMRVRLLPYATQITDKDGRAYRAYETKRLSKFYGLRRKDLPYHVAETKLRYSLRNRYGALILDVTEDLMTQ